MALNSQQQTNQILTNDDQMLILCLSYFITTVLCQFQRSWKLSLQIPQNLADNQNFQTNKIQSWLKRCQVTLFLKRRQNQWTHLDSWTKEDIFRLKVYLISKTTKDTTDYGHTEAKSLILCGPNSNPNPKLIFGMWI